MKLLTWTPIPESDKARWSFVFADQLDPLLEGLSRFLEERHGKYEVLRWKTK